MSETPNASSPDTPLASSVAEEKKQSSLIVTYHSLEPWVLFPPTQIDVPGYCFEVRDANGTIVLYVAYNEELGITKLELADAALVLAAPRLLRVLRQISDCYTTAQPGYTPWADAWKEADALLTDLKKAGVL